jgi:hypothetical protein
MPCKMDIYGNFILEDDAGQKCEIGMDCAIYINVLPGGLQFCEINGRTYVQSIQGESFGAVAGILTRS